MGSLAVHNLRQTVPIRLRQGIEEAGRPRILPFPRGEVKCKARLGGLLKHYYRAA